MVTPSENPWSAGTGSPSSAGGRAGEDTLKHRAGELAGEAKSEGHAKVDEMRGTAADTIDTLADSARAAAAKLKDDDIGHLSDYVSELAQSMGKLSSNMREKTGDDLLHEVSRLARDNPALFVTGSIAIGFGLSRFAKASTPTTTSESTNDRRTDNAAQGSSTRSESSASSSTVGSASTRGTGSGGSVPPYGAQAPTRTTTPPGNANGDAGQQQPGVRP